MKEKKKKIEIFINDSFGNGISGNGLAGNGLSGNGLSGNGCSNIEFDDILSNIESIIDEELTEKK